MHVACSAAAIRCCRSCLGWAGACNEWHGCCCRSGLADGRLFHLLVIKCRTSRWRSQPSSRQPSRRRPLRRGPRSPRHRCVRVSRAGHCPGHCPWHAAAQLLWLQLGHWVGPPVQLFKLCEKPPSLVGNPCRPRRPQWWPPRRLWPLPPLPWVVLAPPQSPLGTQQWEAQLAELP